MTTPFPTFVDVVDEDDPPDGAELADSAFFNTLTGAVNAVEAAVASKVAGDLPEAAAIATTAVTATALLSKITRFATGGGAVTQPLPAALAGRLLAIGWESGANALTYTAASRTDTGSTTNASATVGDTSITTADKGKVVTGAGIPAGSYVGQTMTAGTSFKLSSSPTSQVDVTATATGGSVSLTISDAIGPANTVSTAVPVLGEIVELHCTVAGRWRATAAYRPITAFPFTSANTDVSGASPGAFPAVDVVSPLHLKLVSRGPVHAQDLGIKFDAREVADAAMTASSTTLTSATAAFTSADVGKKVTVARAGSGAASTGQMLVATISSVTNATTAVLSVAATNTVSAKGAIIGTDDTAAWAAALTALPAGATVQMPLGKSLITTNLTLAKAITFAGYGADENWGSVVASGVSLDSPPAFPYFFGSEIIQAGAGLDIFTLGAAGITVHARDLVMRWAPGIAFNNTGHGIYAKYGTPALGGSENGIMGSRWDNVAIWGHDGNHYGIYLVNSLYCTMVHIRTYGGGGLHGECDSFYGNYGNSVFDHFQATMWVAGTANCFNLRGRTTGSTGKYNLLQFNRPFGIILNGGAFYDATAGSPTSAQYMFYSDDNTANLTLVAPDFETGISSCTFRFTNNQHWVDPSGLFGATTFFQAIKANRPNAKIMYSDMTFGGQGPASSATMQSGAGTSPPSPVASGTDDTRGNITFGTGTSPTTGALIRINWSANKGGIQGVSFAACNAATAALGLYVSANDATGVTLAATNAPTASQANTVYSISYVAIAP